MAPRGIERLPATLLALAFLAAVQALHAQTPPPGYCPPSGPFPCLKGETWRNMAAGGEVGTYTRYQYDSRGNRINRETFHSVNPDSLGPIQSQIKYTYGPQGLAHQAQFLGGRMQSTVEYQYDARGNLSLSLTKDGQGKLLYEDRFVHDPNEEILLETRRLVGNVLTTSHRFGYDGRGRPVADTLFEKQGDDFLPAQRLATAYDSSGRPLADSSWRRQDGAWYLISTLVRTYRDGRLVAVARYERDAAERRLMDSVAYSYDAAGNRIKEEGFDDEAAPTYSIEYHWVTAAGILAKGSARPGLRLVPVGEGWRAEGPGAGRIALRLLDWRGVELGRADLAPGEIWRARTPAPRGSIALIAQDGARLAVPLLP